jgi:hypothetical protein
MNHDDLELVWAQDFSTPGPPDPQWWSYALGHGHNGWGNRELQTSQDGTDVCTVRDGRLVITGLHHPGAPEELASASGRLIGDST